MGMENRVPGGLGLLWRHRPDIDGVDAVRDVRFEVIENYLLPLQWSHSGKTGIDHADVAMGILFNDRSVDARANRVLLTGAPALAGPPRLRLNPRAASRSVAWPLSAARVRTPSGGTAHGEHWLFRPKDRFGWWSNPHHDRPGGVRAATPTAWAPRMKPIRLTEVGCAAVDRGPNAPNLFQDPKSSENALPPHSGGTRDDTAQRPALEAILGHYAQAENNPESGLYDGRMLEAADLWCWDARPYPAFPALDAVWADGSAWNAGHWLNGRLVGAGAAAGGGGGRRGPPGGAGGAHHSGDGGEVESRPFGKGGLAPLRC